MPHCDGLRRRLSWGRQTPTRRGGGSGWWRAAGKERAQSGRTETESKTCAIEGGARRIRPPPLATRVYPAGIFSNFH
eukprot:3220364-Pyramimonas_sp.AAC.1